MWRTLSILLLCWALTASPSQACKCGQEAFCKKAQRADYLFRGLVQDVHASRQNDTVYVVLPVQMFKSPPGVSPPSTFILRSPSSPSACGLKLAVGDDYLFAADVELWVSSCGASKPWESVGNDDMDVLKAGCQCPDCAALKCGSNQRCTTPVGGSAVCVDVCLPGRCGKSETCNLVTPNSCGIGPCASVAACKALPPPTPRCLRNCTSDFNPVCGSNGVTYTNECFLANAACKGGADAVRLAKEGPCCTRNCCKFRECRPFSKGEYCTDTCHAERCPKGQRCKLQKSKACTTDICPQVAICEPACNLACPDKYAPVCGSNGVTFGNLCELQRAQCEDPSLVAIHHGICSLRDAACGRSIACPEIYEPVCGSNDVTYPNICYLERARCREANLVIKNEGTCETSCDFSCARTGGPVCSNQGVTYANECLLKQAACKHGNIWMKKSGACDKCP